jgi:hypothetical protein
MASVCKEGGRRAQTGWQLGTCGGAQFSIVSAGWHNRPQRATAGHAGSQQAVRGHWKCPGAACSRQQCTVQVHCAHLVVSAAKCWHPVSCHRASMHTRHEQVICEAGLRGWARFRSTQVQCGGHAWESDEGAGGSTGRRWREGRHGTFRWVWR